MLRVSLHTLGCKLNFAETSTLAREFERRSYDVVPFGEPADVTVINTCTVTENAEQTCRRAVRRAVAASEHPFVVVTGCYAQLRPDEIASIDGVDLVVGNAEKQRLFELGDGFRHSGTTQIAVSCIDDAVDFGPAYSATERTRAFLKVQDGCNYSCSFCTIPAARGPSRSASISETLDQAREIVDRGYSEIVISGVNVGLYGEQHKQSLLDLLQSMVTIDGLRRIRISSIEPNLLTDEIIDFVAEHPVMMPHFHIPLQSGSDTVLAWMRRRYRRDLYDHRVERIMQAMPHACVGVDVIVGFPGETDELFDETARFIADLPVSYLHVFTYSERPDTVASERSGKELTPVPKVTRRERNRILRELSSRKRRIFYEGFLGTERPVLWEAGDGVSSMTGFTDNYIKVRAPFDASAVGAIQTARIDQIGSDGVAHVSDGFMLLEESAW